MAFKYFDRVSVASSTTGTGTLTLGAALDGYRTFASVFSNADTTFYTIQESSTGNWEVGLGTYSSGANTLARTSVSASSNSGSLVNFTSGTLVVFVDLAALQFSGSNGLTTGTGALVFANSPTITGIVGVGDVVGPAGATDNAIAVYDGVTGKLLKNSSPTVSGSAITASLTGNVTGNVSGSSGSTTGNAATATALQNARTIGAVSFDGTSNIVPQTIQTADDSSDSSCFPLFGNASGAQSQQPKTNSGFTYNSTTNALGATTFTGAVVGNSSTATALATARAIYGNNFDGTAALTQIIASTFGGTGNGFTKFSGPASSEKTFTLPNASDTVACIGQVNAYTAQQYFPAVALTSSSNSIAWNAQTAQAAKHTATENTTLANPTNLVDGATYTFIWTQHASSPKTLAFGNAYKWAGGVVPVATPTNSAVDIYTFYSNGTNMYGVVQYAFA